MDWYIIAYSVFFTKISTKFDKNLSILQNFGLQWMELDEKHSNYLESNTREIEEKF